ncbi:recombinase family protein [Flavobacterium rakeshii]|uniref:Recombinase family protein n=1 Tax=Flavobacterium rakeshii TaxID=1038845 RepID=A0A6N8HI25_9FLAO|nr:recombinase family protein [Flavobacterium rakeshii]MUV05395.1 recombinase family protein [Flavobacterium rakeshii]
MKIADLYVRVSTDEQADKGYSQRNQEEVLRRYCEINSIQVRNVIYEDHSAKSFIRPEWKKLENNLKKYRNKIDLVLFTKWDRFSRNAGDAYQMINKLRTYGVEPQAIEQPLDLSVPENKMMLAFYLAAPEVENDRRALNTFHGMRRAKKEGRCLGIAPLGYKNIRTEEGKKIIAIKEPQATYVRWVFKELSKGILAAEEVRREANKKGMKCSRGNFWTLVRNPVYCGKIFIPKYKDEEAHFVPGIHEPLITEKLFYKVQDILDGKKRNERIRTVLTVKEQFPLRGFLVCPDCGRMLTGSASKGAYYLYHYYHCVSPCKFRFRADKLNLIFEEELKKYVPLPVVKDLYKIVVLDLYKKRSSKKQNTIKRVTDQIDKLNARISKARDLLLSDAIDSKEYKEIKSECENKIIRLEAELTDKSDQQNNSRTISKLLDSAVHALSRLHTLYKEGDIRKKREIISSIFPEKICFDGNECRTFRVNEAARFMFLINSNLQNKKDQKRDDFSLLSGLVASTGIEPVSKV